MVLLDDTMHEEVQGLWLDAGCFFFGSLEAFIGLDDLGGV